MNESDGLPLAQDRSLSAASRIVQEAAHAMEIVLVSPQHIRTGCEIKEDLDAETKCAFIEAIRRLQQANDEMSRALRLTPDFHSQAQVVKSQSAHA